MQTSVLVVLAALSLVGVGTAGAMAMATPAQPANGGMNGGMGGGMMGGGSGMYGGGMMGGGCDCQNYQYCQQYMYDHNYTWDHNDSYGMMP